MEVEPGNPLVPSTCWGTKKKGLSITCHLSDTDASSSFCYTNRKRKREYMGVERKQKDDCPISIFIPEFNQLSESPPPPRKCSSWMTSSSPPQDRWPWLFTPKEQVRKSSNQSNKMRKEMVSDRRLGARPVCENWTVPGTCSFTWDRLFLGSTIKLSSSLPIFRLLPYPSAEVP